MTRAHFRQLNCLELGSEGRVVAIGSVRMCVPFMAGVDLFSGASAGDGPQEKSNVTDGLDSETSTDSFTKGSVPRTCNVIACLEEPQRPRTIR